MSFNIECANCGGRQELPENSSLARLWQEAASFLTQHQAGGSGIRYCHKDHLFIRTFELV